jgi:hypothetical protein
VQSECTDALNAYDPPTDAEMDAGFAAISAAAIADAVWDEALADHDTEDTVGNVINDLTEESGGTYRFTSAAVQASLGAGATSETITIQDADTNPISECDVWVTSDEAGNTVIASGTTDGNGEVTFQLNTGTVYVWAQKAGYNITNPTTVTIS